MVQKKRVRGKCSVQIVDLSGERPRHVRKFTFRCSATLAVWRIMFSLGGHLVSGKNGQNLPAIPGKNAVQPVSRARVHCMRKEGDR
jgi:hypothetical protein